MLRKICNILSTTMLGIMGLIAAVLILPNLIGFKSMAVLSGSMEPNISVGSIVFVREVEADTLEVGDVISYRLSGTTAVTHRINSIDPATQQFITKGDANESVDSAPISANQIMGKVMFHLPLLGYISIYIRTPLGIAVACGVFMVLILLTYLPDIFAGKKAKQEEEKNEEI